MSMNPSPALPWRAELVFRRRGGLAGFDDRLSIRPDGTAALQHARGTVVAFRVEPAALAALGTALNAAGAARSGTAMPRDPSADRMHYELVLDGAATTFAAEDVPASLQRAFAALEKLLSR